MNPKKFTATTSWRKSMRSLPDRIRLEVYDALFDYVETGKEPEMTLEAKVAFSFIRTDIDLEVDKTIAVCEKWRENVMKRWHRGTINSE